MAEKGRRRVVGKKKQEPDNELGKPTGAKPLIVDREDQRSADDQVVKALNNEAIQSGGAPSNPDPAAMHAKVVSILVSVGTDDRDRTIEQFTEAIETALKSAKVGGKGRGSNVTVMQRYYILDGKVCLAPDYDAEHQNFKPGAVPPSWAGGPLQRPLSELREQADKRLGTRVGESTRISAREWDKKYPGGVNPNAKKPVIPSPDESLEEFEWDMDDVTDVEKLSKASDKDTAAAIKKMKGAKGRKVVRKRHESASALQEPPKRKVIKRKKGK